MESTLSLSSKLTGTSPLIYLETNNPNRTWQDWKLRLAGGQPAGCLQEWPWIWSRDDWEQIQPLTRAGLEPGPSDRKSARRWPLSHTASHMYSIDLLRVTPTSVLTFLSPIFSSLNLRGHCFIGGHCISNSPASISAVSKLCPSCKLPSALFDLKPNLVVMTFQNLQTCI